MLLGVAVDKMFYESYGTGGWLQWGALLAAAIASPMLCANAVMSGRPLPTFLELLGPRDGRTDSVLTALLGLVLGRHHADRGGDRARLYVRSALPRFSVRLADHGGGAVRGLDAAQPAERGRAPDRRIRVCRLAWLAAALFIGFNEGNQNWQSMWTCAIYLLLALTLWRARAVQIPK